MRSVVKKVKELSKKYFRQISAISLIGGFVIDNFTLQRIDLLFENLVLIFYLVLIASSIIYINFYNSKKEDLKLNNKNFFICLSILSPIGLQYALGGLFSGFFIFYFRSASLGTSWPFLLFLLLVLVGNEIFSKKLNKLSLQTSILFVSIFSFSIFYIPVLIGKLDVWVFILSGLVSLLLIYIFLLIIKKIERIIFEESKKKIVSIVLIIYFGINFAYFTNIIPPIPLSLKNIQIAHETNRTTEGYKVITPKRYWYEKIFPYQKFEIEKGRPIYIYSSVFAPTKLQTDILHEWQFKNSKGDWQTMSEVSFPIKGGRDGGYRGYTILWNTKEGNWRVSIKTKNGQIIGRTNFKVEYVDEIGEVETKIY